MSRELRFSANINTFNACADRYSVVKLHGAYD
jgi:hypothetical protein